MKILINLLFCLLPVMAIEKVPMIELDFEAYQTEWAKKIITPTFKVTGFGATEQQDHSRYVHFQIKNFL